MSHAPYIGEIRMFAGNFAPAGWMFCEGQPLPIAENDTLFTIIGTTFGGDGEETFNLPDLRGRIPLHMGSLGGISYVIGEKAGVESVTLTTQQIPNHTHPMLGSSNTGTLPDPGNNVRARSSTPGAFAYGADVPDVNLALTSASINGGSQPHDNMQPYLCVNFIISLFGVFPSET